MSPSAELRPLPRRARAWLIHLADPIGRAARPAHPLSPGDIGATLAAAELHGVLPAALRGARRLVEGDLRASAGRGSIDAIATAREKVALQTGLGLMLVHQAGRVMRAFQEAGIEGTVVKGAVAAQRLYAEASLRTFTDVDVLIGARHRTRASEMLRGLGFELFTFPDRAGQDYEEDKWLLGGDPKIMVEVHSNLVHSPKLRAAMGVRYEDVLEAGAGDATAPTALMLVAGAHAAIGHQFDRLQHLVDIVQAARGAAGPIDVERLRRVADRSGVLLAVATAIELAGRTFGEPQCAELAHRLDPASARGWRRFLVTPDLVAAAQSLGRARGSWRRNLYRRSLRLGTPA